MTLSSSNGNASYNEHSQSTNQENINSRDEEIAAFRREQAELLADLREIGINAETVWSHYTAVEVKKSSKLAIPILAKHLTRPYSDVVRDGIARRLAIPQARVVWNLLFDEYCKTPVAPIASVKEGLAVALSAAVTPKTLPKLIELIKNPIHGESRLLLTIGLRRSKQPIALQAISDLANDPVFSKEIASWSRSKK